jgi:hypothetical protein
MRLGKKERKALRLKEARERVRAAIFARELVLEGKVWLSMDNPLPRGLKPRKQWGQSKGRKQEQAKIYL